MGDTEKGDKYCRSSFAYESKKMLKSMTIPPTTGPAPECICTFLASLIDIYIPELSCKSWGGSAD